MDARSPPLAEFRDVGLSLGGNEIIRHLDLRIDSGEIVCLIGASGSGKTTTLRLLAGLTRPSGGEVFFDGAPVTAPRPEVAVVFQDYTKALLPWRTAAGNVSLVLETLGVPKPERAERVRRLLARVGLAGKESHYPGQMSGGMQQRLQIARCLAQEPRLLLMDEPFGALDAMTRQSLQDEMLAIVADTGATVFFVTHDLDEAAYLGDRVIGLLSHPGRVGVALGVALPRPRDQLGTRAHPDFLRLRQELFNFIKGAER